MSLSFFFLTFLIFVFREEKPKDEKPDWVKQAKLKQKTAVQSIEAQQLEQSQPKDEQPAWVKQAKAKHKATIQQLEQQQEQQKQQKTAQETQEQTEQQTQQQKTVQKKGVPPEGESSVHGREVHVAKQKQTQKEVCVFYTVVAVLHFLLNEALCVHEWCMCCCRLLETQKSPVRLLLLRLLRWNTRERLMSVLYRVKL